MLELEQKSVEYAEIKMEISKLTDRAEVLKSEIEAEMIQNNTDELELDCGKINLQKGKTKWEYPEDIVKDEKDLKARMKTAQQLGTAKEVEGKPFIVFNSNKIQE